MTNEIYTINFVHNLITTFSLLFYHCESDFPSFVHNMLTYTWFCNISLILYVILSLRNCYPYSIIIVSKTILLLYITITHFNSYSYSIRNVFYNSLWSYSSTPAILRLIIWFVKIKFDDDKDCLSPVFSCYRFYDVIS